MNSRTKIGSDRRSFLRMLGGAGVTATMARALPLVGGTLATRRAHASGVKRVVFVYTPNGAPKGLWLPNGSTMNLSTQAYDGVKSVCNFREVSVVGSGHGNQRKCLGELRWSQDWTGDSIDQQIASVIGTTTPFPSYALGVQTNASELIGRKSGSSVPAQDDPGRAYQQLFGGTPPAGDAGISRKQRVMDLHRDALRGLRTQLDGFERELLDANEQALTELEARLQAASTPPADATCSAPAWNENGYPTTGSNAGNGAFALQSELQSDIITAAFRCGITNVFTLQLGWHQATWFGHDTNFSGDHHNSCHAAPATDNAEMTNYLSRCVAYLIQRLMDEDDPGSPGNKLIDSTVVVQVTDMGDGQDHSGGRGPSMVATRMPSFQQGTVTSGGNNYEVLEAVVEGLGLGAHKGTNVDAHAIWPAAGGSVATDILT